LHIPDKTLFFFLLQDNLSIGCRVEYGLDNNLTTE